MLCLVILSTALHFDLGLREELAFVLTFSRLQEKVNTSVTISGQKAHFD